MSHKAPARNDRGISMLWTAIVLLFLVAAAALAVDTGGAFGAARTDQNTADLACLAGVKELPDQTAAINTAVAYIDDNWPDMSGATLTITLPTATYVHPSGNSASIDAQYGGSADEMYIEITEITETSFGKVIGQDTITVTQEAACGGQSVQVGTGMLPMAALPGGWNGNLFDCAENKTTGNCGAITPFGGGGSDFRDSTGDGVDGNFLYHWGIETDVFNGIARENCSNGTDPCNAFKTETGNMVGPFRQGLGDRLDTPGINQSCVEPFFNCDTLAEVLGAMPVPLSGVEPSWWPDTAFGPYTDARDGLNGVDHYFYNGQTLACDSPRLATIPIIAWSGNNKPLNWTDGDATGSLPNGKKYVKIVGFYTVYIREPDTVAEITGSDAIVVDILWFGEDARCSNGTLFQPFGAANPVDAGVKLVAP